MPGFFVKGEGIMRKGISVIEVLIVIIVISVLAAMMFFSSTEAVETARATAIINNLSKMKEAMTVWYLENKDRLVYTSDGFHIRTEYNSDGTWKGNGMRLHDYFYKYRSEVAVYFDSSGVAFNDYKEGDQDWTSKSKDKYYASTGNYSVYFGYGNKKLYVVAKIADRNSGSEAVLRRKLKARAQSAGLLTYDYSVKGADDKKDNKDWVYDGESANVLMEVIDLSPFSVPGAVVKK